MTQIKITREGVDLYDLALEDADDSADGEHLAMDETFQSAILISLLTDRRCEPSEALDPTDLGGYWADTYADVPGDVVGSRLWTLAGRVWSEETRAAADGYVREALEWMVADGIIASVQNDVEVELEFDGHTLRGRVVIRKPNSSVPRWDVVWHRTLS